jgi:hypothetical protein
MCENSPNLITQFLRGDLMPEVTDLEVLDVAWLELGDIAVPQVVDDLGEVDAFRQSPGNVLTNAFI